MQGYLPRLLPLFFGLVSMGAIPAAAQLPFTVVVEGRGALAIPTGEFAGSERSFRAGSGPGYAAGARVQFAPFVGLYTGFRSTRFACGECPTVGLDDEVTMKGGEAALHFEPELAVGPVAPWIRLGVLRHTLGFSGFDERMTSEPALAFSGSAGVTLPLTGGVELVPAVQLFGGPARFRFDAFPDRTVDATGVSLELGLSYRF
jgi:hypothetical protein